MPDVDVLEMAGEDDNATDSDEDPVVELAVAIDALNHRSAASDAVDAAAGEACAAIDIERPRKLDDADTEDTCAVIGRSAASAD